MRGIILAGGRATRLGPLTAQMNKALVSIGQRPILIHQLELLRDAGATEVVVVTSPDSQLQVSGVLERSVSGLGTPGIRCVAQECPLGPADALRVGLAELSMHSPSGDVVVLMADTFIDEVIPGGDWYGVGEAPVARDWCYADDQGFFHDGHAPVGAIVTIGAYRFADSTKLWSAVSDACTRGGTNVGMAPVLNRYTRGDGTWHEFSSWLDVGDVTALGRARRKRFITRDFNEIELTSDGRVLKRGSGSEFEREARYYRWMDETDAPGLLLYPRLTDWRERPSRVGDEPGAPLMFGLEFVDMPTLAELYLYWPGRPDMWSNVLETVLERLIERLWRFTGTHDDLKRWREEMYYYKVTERLNRVGLYESYGPLARELYEYIIAHDDVSRRMSTGHGDLNFANILYSLGTGVFKLIDPRGDRELDIAYELAKLRYSYRDGFNAITHGLCEVDISGDVCRLGPERSAEAIAMDEVMSRYFPDVSLDVVSAIEATIFLSAIPLHPGRQRPALLHQGLKLAREVLRVPGGVDEGDTRGRTYA